MSYTPDATVLTEPTDSQKASVAAAEFRTLKTYIHNVVLPLIADKLPLGGGLLTGPLTIANNSSLNWLDSATVPRRIAALNGSDDVYLGNVDNATNLTSVVFRSKLAQYWQLNNVTKFQLDVAGITSKVDLNFDSNPYRIGYNIAANSSTIGGISTPNYGLALGNYFPGPTPGMMLHGFYGVSLAAGGASRLEVASNGDVTVMGVTGNVLGVAHAGIVSILGQGASGTTDLSIAKANGGWGGIDLSRNGIGSWKIQGSDFNNALFISINSTLALSIDGGLTAAFGGTVTAPSFVGPLTGNVSGNVSGNAGSASSVAWTNVTARPTALSQFTNDLSSPGLTSAAIVSALGFTPYSNANPASYTTLSAVASQGYLTGINGSMVTSALGFTPIAGINSGMVTSALGFTPYNATNPNSYTTLAAVAGQGYLTGINSGHVTGALGFTPYNATNPSGYTTLAAVAGQGYLTGINAGMINSALALNVGTNAVGTRTVSTGAPSGGSDGDIWYQV